MRVNSAKKFHHAVVSGFVGLKDECKRLGRHIFIFLGKSLLDDVTKYGWHILSFAEHCLYGVGIKYSVTS
jgi:hypothetical protein